MCTCEPLYTKQKHHLYLHREETFLMFKYYILYTMMHLPACIHCVCYFYLIACDDTQFSRCILACLLPSWMQNTHTIVTNRNIKYTLSLDGGIVHHLEYFCMLYRINCNSLWMQFFNIILREYDEQWYVINTWIFDGGILTTWKIVRHTIFVQIISWFSQWLIPIH